MSTSVCTERNLTTPISFFSKLKEQVQSCLHIFTSVVGAMVSGKSRYGGNGDLINC